MSKQKRTGLLAGVLACCLLLTGTAGAQQVASETITIFQPFGAQTPREAPGMGQGEQRAAVEGSHLTVGTASGFSGNFYSNMWGYNATDMDVRLLLHGYHTVALTQSAGFALDDTVLTGTRVTVDGDGNKTYTFTLREGLCYNDGSPITAEDYVFTVLLQSSQAAKDLGADITAYAHLVGYRDFASGKTRAFAGVRLLNQRQFSLQISKDALEYFYELLYVDVQPTPRKLLAGDAPVVDRGLGAYFDRPLTAQALASTLTGPQGYLHAPRLTCGAYQLESFDEAAGVMELSLNRNYLGNYEGMKPVVEKIVIRTVGYDQMPGMLASGELDLVNKVAGQEAVAQMTQAVKQGAYASNNYIRAGYSFLAFACEEGPTASVKVRQAIAYSLDKDALMQDYVGDNGLRVYGCYGLGQWMTLYTAAEGEKPLNIGQELDKLPHYDLDLDMAKKLLASDGWNLNAQGQKYEEGPGNIRYKKIDGVITPLMLKWAKAKGSMAADAAEAQMTKAFAAIGIGLDITTLPFDQLLRHYYRQEARTYQLFLMGTNFAAAFDPYLLYNTGDAYQGTQNTSGLKDDSLMKLGLALRDTKPGHYREYCAKWLKFQDKWADLLPAVPLYSNVYFDFYANRLRDYNISSFASWALAMPYVNLE